MADPAKTVLGRMLTDEITPVVMVLRTPLVEEACQKNGLSFVDMLSPFAIFDNIDVPVRTASDQSYRLQQFKLRLCYASDIQKPPFEAARERLNKVITEAAERDTSYLSSELADTKQELSTSKAYSLPSWFEVVNKELIRASSFSDHEAFDHPVACLLVVSSKDDDPINKFVDLFNTNQLPSILNDGAMDPQILKHFLLLHDNQDGPPENASKVLSDMKSMFGSSDCQLLCINSSQDGSSGGRDWPWASYQRLKVSFLDNLGCLLSLDDINEMKVFMHALSTKHVIPHMEQKIRVLNLQVSATRKGFRNQIKNLWWRKGKDDSSDTPTGPTYTYTSIESQIRVLGDYAFMLQDYELALSNYRLISTDYKLDKAWQRYAGVQELMGLTYFMLDQSRKEAEYCMETAFTTYLKLGTQCQQNAVRCGLWWVELLKAWEQHKDAASVYFRISGEDPLQSAIMLEQASYCYLYSVPSMPRKYGFHLVLSGDSYDRCKQTRHAIRAYKTALSVFESTTWSLIKDHIRFQLGKWFASLGMLDIAINHMLEILACTHQSKTAQELFLHDFLQLVQKTGKTFEVCRLQLPIVRLPSLRVVFEDQRTYASPAAVGVRESVWLSLEENVVPPLANAKVNWLELHTKLVPKDYKESNICVAGEAVKVDIGFKNPLQIPISISNVSLVCKHLALDDEIGEDASSTATGAHDNEDLRQFIASNESCQSNSSVTLSEVDFSLNGGETLLVQLTATPREEGILKVVGVRWKLSGSVVGFQNFEFSDIKKRNAKGRRKSKRSPGCELKFLVIKPLPRLEGSIRHFPKRSYHGELYRLVLELRNQSDSVVKNVKLKISHPRFLLVANPEAMNSEFPACLTDESSGEDATASKGQEVNSLFQFPEDVVIHGKPFTSPLWLHAAIPGPLSLQIIVYYEVGDASSIIRYRTLRMSYNLEVLPSLEVSFKISRCPSRSQEVFVCMDAINKTSSETFQVCQLSAVGSQWGIMMLPPFDIPWHQIAPGQALSLFFRLKNSTKRVVGSENKISSDDNGWGSHVRLGVEVNNKAVYNVLKSPLADFHHHERLQQEQPEQEGPSESVEFILISQPETNEQQLSAQSRLFSHHACHCSLASTGPLYWLVDGPKTIYHDFTSAFCEINLKMSIYNSLNTCLSVNISTHDNSNLDQTGDSAAVSSENEIGWHCVSLDKEKKVLSDGSGTPSSGKHALSESAPSFIWTGISSTKVELGPSSAVELPMQICVFTPGIYDISSYQLQWNLVQSEGRNYKGEETSGVCSGRPFFITVVQCT